MDDYTERKIKQIKPKIWEPTDSEDRLVRSQYATYNSKSTMTKSRIMERFKVSGKAFQRYVDKHKIKSKQDPQKKPNKCLDGYIRVAVPCRLNCTTFLLIKPGRDVEKAVERYMEKFEKG